MESAGGLEPAQVEPFVDMVLGWIDREYPCWLGHELAGPGDARPPRELTPVFWSCYDWHSCVHSHWTLARAAHRFPGASFAPACRAVLEHRLQSEPLRVEAAFVAARPTFERPYGLAWLLQLDAELATWPEAAPRVWRAALAPLVEASARTLSWWLERLTRPVRSGAHGQSAFAMGLLADWARDTGAAAVSELVRRRGIDLYGADRALPLHLEPSGEDFLSPSLAEADLLRRILAPGPFARWLDGAMPTLGRDALPPATVVDREDGRLSHLDGLNLSRAWMLRGIAGGLPGGDDRVVALQATARAHREAALASLAEASDSGGHWLGSFATYMLTDRGAP